MVEAGSISGKSPIKVWIEVGLGVWVMVGVGVGVGVEIGAGFRDRVGSVGELVRPDRHLELEPETLLTRW